MICSTFLHFKNSNILRGLYVTHSKIYDGAFIAKTVGRLVYSQENSIVNACLGFKAPLPLTVQTFYFFKVFEFIRLLQSAILKKYF